MNLTYKYLKRMIRNVSNTEFKKFILNCDADPFWIRFQELGNQNSDNIVYIIENDRASHGFFAEYRMTLNYLAFADRYRFLPYIFYNKNYAYAENEEFLGTDNPFEYYFKQPFKMSYDIAFSSKNVVFARNAHGDMIEALNHKCCSYEISDEYINQAANIVRKYMLFNEETDQYLKQECKKVFAACGGKILGIHYRGTDFKQNYNNHPVAIAMEQFIEKAKEAVALEHFSNIFLATDDLLAIDKFKSEFGDMVIYYRDVFRGTEDVSVAFSKDNRRRHHYHLGLEVLRDMHTLARCDGLIAGLSQVSNMARVNKKAIGEEYLYKCILNDGINFNKKKFCLVESGND